MWGCGCEVWDVRCGVREVGVGSCDSMEDNNIC